MIATIDRPKIKTSDKNNGKRCYVWRNGHWQRKNLPATGCPGRHSRHILVWDTSKASWVKSPI